MNKTDIQLKNDIEQELAWDPKVNAAQIGVTVDQGAVSLMGTVDSYAEKWAAEGAAKPVSGARTVAQELTVKEGTWVRILHPFTEGRIVAAARDLDVGQRVRVELIQIDVERGFIDFARVERP